MNLGYNTFKPEEFKAILNAVPLETTISREKMRSAMTAPPESGIASSEGVGASKAPRNASKLFNVENGRSFTRNYPAFEAAKKPVGEIGWGVNLKSASGLNKQEPRIAKPTIKWLDLAKQSNFINYL